MTLTDIAAQLAEPFPLEDIDFLPKGKVERDGKTFCMALPYADPRVYQDRLNKVAYGEWSTPAPVVLVAGNKLICYVTVIICGIAHTDVGEATNNEENTGTEAYAQAFKRACSQVGLGRYLYDLEKEWVPFNVQRKQIDLDKAQKAAIVRKMYQKAGIVVPGTAQPQANEPKVSQNPKPETSAPAPDDSGVPTVKELQERCARLFGVGYFQSMVLKALQREEPIRERDLLVEQRVEIAKFLDRQEKAKALRAGKQPAA
jgi:hypothetical protein